MQYQKYFLILILLILVSGVYALSASIGNARMVLRPTVEEGSITTIEKTIQVNNVNDVPVIINAKSSREFEDILTIPEPEFILEPGETKNMDFIITLEYGGRYEGKINIAFKPADPESKSSGVGLSSTIIILAEGPENPNPPPVLDEEDSIPPPPSINETGTEEEVEEDNESSVDNIVEDEELEELPTISAEKKPNPLIGIALIIAILAVGIAVFILINKRS